VIAEFTAYEPLASVIVVPAVAELMADWSWDREVTRAVV
jgi:hypothetical protein